MAVGATAESGVDGCGVADALAMCQGDGFVCRFTDNGVECREDESCLDILEARSTRSHRGVGAVGVF